MDERPVKQRFPTWKQALLILCSGMVLAGSSCAAFLATVFKEGSHLPGVFAAGFYVGAAMALVGFILVLIRALRGPGGPRQ